MQIIIRIFLMVSFLIILVPLTVNADYYTKYNQNVTAYSASKYKTNGNTRFVASGLVPKAGYVAMRNDAPVPFGSTVTTPSTIMQGDGQSFSSFSVQDRGVSTSLTPYAIDIWWGFCRDKAYTGSGATVLGCSQNDKKFVGAKNFGKKTMDLKFITR